MRPVLRTTFLATASIALAACSDGPSPAVTGPAKPPVGINPSLSLTCDFNEIKSAVKAVAASSTESRDIINAMQKAYGDGDFATATNLGFDGEARLAVIRGDPTLKNVGATPTQFAAAATSYLACMNVGAIPDAFPTNIIKAMGSGGLFEVPGSSPVPASASGGVFARGETPFWGAVPAQGATWLGSTNNKRFIMYGFKIPYGPQQGNADPLLNPNAPQGLNGFDYATLPVIGEFNSPVTIGVCGLDAGNNGRIKHAGEILGLTALNCPLNPPVLASTATPEGGFASLAWLARQAMSVFTPQPLNATALIAGIAPSGGTKNLSPTAAISVAVTLQYTSQPTDGFVNTVIPGTPPDQFVKVQVTTPAGTPLINARVVITVFGNNGKPVSANGATAFTDASGVATFNALTVNKAGGYRFTANANFDNLVGPAVVSNLANIQNRTP